MDIAKSSIERPVVTWLIVVICLVGGIWGFNNLGKLEDPSFTIPNAIINTPYPGATAQEVEEEVTERLEMAIQELQQIDVIESLSMPGRSEIEVEVASTYRSHQLPQIWDELRRKINDTQAALPEGASPSQVNDDFGEVYGIFYAVTAPGYSESEIRDVSRFLQREILTVPNVARVATAGEREEAIYIEIPNERLTTLGIPVDHVINTIQTENQVADAGSMRIGDDHVRIVVRAGVDSVANIESIRIGRPGTTEQISLVDIATVTRQAVEVPGHLIRHNGEPAFTLAVAGVAEANIVEVGEAVERHLQALEGRIPLGVELQPIYEQHRVVDEAINDFLLNLAMSVSIVIGVLCLFMGWRVGMVVGATLLLTVLGTLFFMWVFDIEMERVSLGALIIAMGMLVDNAIVVAEGMLINMQRGKAVKEAASEAAGRTQIPLLGATVIGILAFSGIGLSDDVTGEFLFSLFAVIAVSLLLSWALAVTVTPLFGYYLFRNAQLGSDKDPHGGLIYRLYAHFLSLALRLRVLTVTLLVGVTAACAWGFTFVSQSFFPDSNTPMFYVNYELPRGSDIRATRRDAERIETYLLDKAGVEAVSTFIGRGATRFMLTYAPEQPDPAYAQFIVRAESLERIAELDSEVYAELQAFFPEARVRTQRIQFGPGTGAQIEARFHGSDPVVLRRLADEAKEIMRGNPALIDIRQDWREQETVVAPQFNEERARIAGVSRDELAQTLQFASSGVRAGTYREGDSLIPIIARPPENERRNVSRLADRMVWSSAEQRFIPIAQIVDGFATESQEALIHRRNRVRTLTVQADPAEGYTANAAFSTVRGAIEDMTLPPGYALTWGGEYENSSDAQESLARQLPLSFVAMLVVSILLFGKLRQPLIIWLVVPMSICGVVIGLLLTGLPFSFTALLGMLSLSGMLMKNAIVLVDEIDAQIKTGKERLSALLDASTSRLRPVTLAAGTTILGMLPLLFDAFFNSMAVTIMGGLAFASLLTLIAVPVFYSLLFAIPGHESQRQD
ncbi:efflux RND transporter permease subunit [Billgrantia tianxiuensis]|jgi:multidrug efflux pump subunit AcrB|uniref:Efflux RND transporter permease subunit n=1 Tax=Billgrantia tianxiuensis TaxID=2497861 RepID=A0A6I6STS7_9GAMM|nr:MULTISPECIES: efflux RND transporter permease subunit [Halomonas]MCE8034442.1 efflux RND transporter permease subunit [Halomonas sp. MCCC 1A11057]QHC50333.1 efflux RND transporter permease subunit [Halomonas tianxiuensis]